MISPNSLGRKSCGKAQFPYFGRFARNSTEIAIPQNFYPMKLGEITLFFTVVISAVLGDVLS